MRSELRVSDLKNRERQSSRLMNVKIPVHVSDAIQKVAQNLGASKTEVVIALLNEGLETAASRVKGLDGFIRAKRQCAVAGCDHPQLSKGLCATHYQPSRKRRVNVPA